MEVSKICRKVLKIFAALALIIFLDSNFATVESAQVNFRQLRGRILMPVMPERIRYRNSRRGPTKIIIQPIEIPRYRQEKAPPIYTQRQPKRPSGIYIQRRPRQYPGQRGTYPPKNFGPPRAKYK